MIDNRKQQSPSSSACCSTGHNISFGDESSFGASVNILEELEIDDDALSQSFDSAIIEDDQTENTIDESEYGEGSATSMLETKCVGDDFGHFGLQHPLALNISIGLQHLKDVTKILILHSKIVTNCKSPT